jgi:hypothetical protein
VKEHFSPAFPFIRKSFALFEDSQALSTFLSKMKIGVKHFWNGTDRGNPKFYEIKLSNATSPTTNLTRDGMGLKSNL